MQQVRRWGWLAVTAALACSSPSPNNGGAFLDDTGGLPDDAAADAVASDALDSAAPPDVAGESDAEADNPDYGNYFDDPDAADVAVAPDVFDDGCSERAKLVYVVTSEGILYSFTPDKTAFKKVGKLGCNAGFAGSPFSMSVDRDATAWVLYWNGASGVGIFPVSTLDASCMTNTLAKVPLSQVNVFGMGFSANGPYQKAETLYVAGSDSSSFWSGQNYLSTVDTTASSLTKGPSIDQYGSVELTGNGLGELYGLFTNSNPPSVRQIDKQTATTQLKSWTLPAKNFSSSAAMAFAQWGGAFYLFYKGTSDSSTNVWQLDATTGLVKSVVQNTGLNVVGAGVSSCAPTQQPVGTP